MSQLAKIFEIVDGVLIVTLKGEVERRNQTATLLDKINLPAQFFSGADFRNRTIEGLIADQIYDPSHKQADHRPMLTPGEVGCALSHRILAEKVVAGEFDSILVLEDDILLLEDNLDAFDDSISSAPRNWNLLYLGYNKNNLSIPFSVRLKLASWYPFRFMLGSKRHNPSTIRRIYRRPYNSHWSYAGCFNGTHAYAIDRSAAQYLVDLQTPVKLEADIALQHLVRFSGLNAYCQNFDVFDQRWDIPSLVGPRAAWQ